MTLRFRFLSSDMITTAGVAMRPIEINDIGGTFERVGYGIFLGCVRFPDCNGKAKKERQAHKRTGGYPFQFSSTLRLNAAFTAASFRQNAPLARNHNRSAAASSNTRP